jgi:hypothetical protein
MTDKTKSVNKADAPTTEKKESITEGKVVIAENTADINCSKVLTEQEYIAALSRFAQFVKFLELVNTYLPYPKTSLMQSLIEKLQNSNESNASSVPYLTYSEIGTLKRAVGSILTLLKAGGVKLPRRVTGAIQDDINALEEHLLTSEYVTGDDEPESNPFSNWLD